MVDPLACLRCGTGRLFDEWGELYCLSCGHRPLSADDAAALAEVMATPMANAPRKTHRSVDAAERMAENARRYKQAKREVTRAHGRGKWQ